MFELLTNGTVERLCRKIAAADIPYGFGGIAKIISAPASTTLLISSADFSFGWRGIFHPELMKYGKT